MRLLDAKYMDTFGCMCAVDGCIYAERLGACMRLLGAKYAVVGCMYAVVGCMYTVVGCKYTERLGACLTVGSFA